MIRLMRNKERGPICRIWTDASIHQRTPFIGCAAVIQETPEAEAYVLAARYPRNWIAGSDGAELIAIAMAVQHIGLDKAVRVFTDSLHNTQAMFRNRPENHAPANYAALVSSNLTHLFNHRNLAVDYIVRRSTEAISLADDMSWFARKGQLEPMQRLAARNDMELRFFTQEPFEAVGP